MKNPMVKVIPSAIFAAALLCAGGARAQDVAFCQVLAKLMPMAGLGLPALKADKLGNGAWLAEITMPRAKACEILKGNVGEDKTQPSYSCTFALPGAKATSELAVELVSKVKACRPDMQRWMTPTRYYFKSPQGTIQISISSALVDFAIHRSK